MFCREQAVQLHRERGRILERGATLAFVGNGNRNFARAFRDEFGIESPVYVDTERRAYEALGMKRGVLAAIGSFATVRAAARAARAGFRQGGVQGDAWQLGGVLVVRPGGGVLYRHLSSAAGDHPPLDDILSALGRRP
jgi:hypothetical protein